MTSILLTSVYLILVAVIFFRSYGAFFAHEDGYFPKWKSFLRALNKAAIFLFFMIFSFIVLNDVCKYYKVCSFIKISISEVKDDNRPNDKFKND